MTVRNTERAKGKQKRRIACFLSEFSQRFRDRNTIKTTTNQSQLFLLNDDETNETNEADLIVLNPPDKIQELENTARQIPLGSTTRQPRWGSVPPTRRRGASSWTPLTRYEFHVEHWVTQLRTSSRPIFHWKQARKEARKRELKKNKKQRQMVRTAVLKGKNPRYDVLRIVTYCSKKKVIDICSFK